MNPTTFDTLQAARDLEASGMDRRQAEATAEVIGRKADLEHLATKADLYRALWVQGAGLIGVQVALAGAVIAVVKLL
jgi:hypothetical protein